MTNLEKIIELAKTSGDLQRRQKQSDKFNCFLDDFVLEVLEKIRKQFHEDNYDRLYKMVSTSYNLFKKVVNAKSLLYKKEASRIWLKRDGKTVDKNYDKFMALTNINTASQSLNKYANVNNVSFMRLKVDSETINYEAIPAENIVILRDDNNPFKIIAILHKIVTNYSYWLYTDEEQICKVSIDFNKTYDIQDNPYIDPNTNLGIISYIPIWAILPMANDFWAYTVNDDLYNCTIQLNVHLTHFNNILKVGCYKQLAFMGVNIEDIKRLYNHVTDGLNPITLSGEQAKIEAVLMATNFMEFIKTINSIASHVLDQHGFDFEIQSDSKQKSSGFAIKLRQDALNDLKEEQQPLFRSYEKQLAYYTVIMANQVFKAGIDLNGSLQIDFWEEVANITAEDTAVYDWQMSKGIKSIKDIFKKFNPDIADDKIEEAIKKNIEEYKTLIGDVGEDTEIENAFDETQKLEGRE